MNNKESLLLDRINEEYELRIQNGGSKNNNVFSKELFISKYGYSNNEIEDLVSALASYGVIKKWITGDFALVID